jgi:transcriptional regulator with XRE-family HTH domain
MNAQVLGTQLASWRRQAGLTQTQLAGLMQTKQSVISRIEAGRGLPTLPVIERFARACGRTEIVLPLDRSTPEPTRQERRRRVQKVLEGYLFNPWDRDPSPAEVRSLLADGLSRDRFERAEGRLDDLYLDRLRQATGDERNEGVEFQSALAVVAARYEQIDWSYIQRRLGEIRRKEGPLADIMKRIDSRIRGRVRRALSEPDSNGESLPD